MWGKPVVPEVKCSEVKAPNIWLGRMPEQKIVCLMSEYKSQEWFAYLIGVEDVEVKGFIVTDIAVPPHESASSGSAEAEPFHTPKNCIGVIHSHHSMGAFHSGTDHDYVDRNYPISVTVAHGNNGGLQYDTVSYMKTPCGKNIMVDCKIRLVPPKLLFNKEEFLKEAKANIDKGKKTLTFVTDWQGQQYLVKEPARVVNYLNPQRLYKGGMGAY